MTVEDQDAAPVVPTAPTLAEDLSARRSKPGNTHTLAEALTMVRRPEGCSAADVGGGEVLVRSEFHTRPLARPAEGWTWIVLAGEVGRACDELLAEEDAVRQLVADAKWRCSR